ncbi:MAG: hypothetical protein QOF43_2284, partial [Gaiellaceae bacterium]|nr:hypothetical protein [Gaiellaceae bacterium]
EAALRDLAAPLGPRGIDVTIEAPPGLNLKPALETLFYRSAQEAIRNIVNHSGASHASFRVDDDAEHVRLVVEDDGRGFTSGVEDGHLGLRLLADLAREVGGTLKVDSAAGTGTRVCIEVPRT